MSLQRNLRLLRLGVLCAAVLFLVGFVL
jgi:hypothetical protein